MPITFVAAGTVGAGTGTATPTMPAGAATGDLLLLVIESEGEDVNTEAAPTGGAWTLVATQASATDSAVDRTRCTVYRAWYAAAINRVVPDAGNHTIARIYAFRGVDPTTPIEATTTGSTATNATSHSAATGLTTLTAGAMVAFAFTHGDNQITSAHAAAALATVTATGDATSSSGSDGLLNLIYGIKTTAGAVGTVTWTVDAAEEDAWVAMAMKQIPVNPTIDNDFLAAGSALYEPSPVKTAKSIALDIVWGY